MCINAKYLESTHKKMLKKTCDNCGREIAEKEEHYIIINYKYTQKKQLRRKKVADICTLCFIQKHLFRH